jgi:hypothetical protein
MNTFHFAQTDRFEGVLSYDYYILHGNNLYRFVSTSFGVDWTNPDLNVEEISGHVDLKQILATFKFTK